MSSCFPSRDWTLEADLLAQPLLLSREHPFVQFLLPPSTGEDYDTYGGNAVRFDFHLDGAQAGNVIVTPGGDLFTQGGPSSLYRLYPNDIGADADPQTVLTPPSGTLQFAYICRWRGAETGGCGGGMPFFILLQDGGPFTGTFDVHATVSGSTPILGPGPRSPKLKIEAQDWAPAWTLAGFAEAVTMQLGGRGADANTRTASQGIDIGIDHPALAQLNGQDQPAELVYVVTSDRHATVCVAATDPNTPFRNDACIPVAAGVPTTAHVHFGWVPRAMGSGAVGGLVTGTLSLDPNARDATGATPQVSATVSAAVYALGGSADATAPSGTVLTLTTRVY